jgi:TIR domain-containing protein
VTPEKVKPSRPAETEPAGCEIFINYRGSDSGSYGVALFLELSRRFGPGRVFLDVESIAAGADYAEQLLSRVRAARVVLAVIGPGWLARGGLFRRPLIKDREDWIRRELAEAFRAGVRVVPVLTDDTDLPAEQHLPACLASLPRCQFRRLRCRDPIADLDRIVRDLVAADPVLARLARHAAAAEPAGVERPGTGTSAEPAAVPGAARGRELAVLAARATRRQAELNLLPPRGPSASELYRVLRDGRRRCWVSYDDAGDDPTRP